MSQPSLSPTITQAGEVTQSNADSWRLSIPAGPAGQYRLAQLDDYSALSRNRFPWQPPVGITLQARTSAENIPGTWGFGLWNDPFSLSLGFGGGVRRLPALPQAAWFFFASDKNYLSLRDDLPGHGPLAATFRSTRLPRPLLALGAPAVPLLAWSPTARLVRRLARGLVHQDAASLSISTTEWHTYTLFWNPDGVTFQIDGESVLQTPVAPRAPLGLVLWLDNQYAAFRPNGRFAYGTLPVESPTWVEIKALKITVK